MKRDFWDTLTGVIGLVGVSALMGNCVHLVATGTHNPILYGLVIWTGCHCSGYCAGVQLRAWRTGTTNE